MATKGVAIRLGTDGKAQVKSDFAEIRQAGETALGGIADRARETAAANESQFKRLAAGYDRAVAEMEAADRRRAANADKLNAIAPRTLLQSRIDASVGGGEGKSARDSAAAFRELLALEDAQIAKTAALKAILDPLAAAQNRYNAELAETRALQAAGHISAEELAQAEVLLKQRLEESTAANDNAARGANAHRAGLQNLGFQASDFFVQISAGTDAVRAFSLQAPQAIQAIAMMGYGAEGSAGKFARFAAFMQTGWGAAITVGVSIIGLLATELFKSGDAAEDSARKQRTLSEVLHDNTSSYKEVTDAINEYNRTKEREKETTTAALAVLERDTEAQLKNALATRERLKSAMELAYSNAGGGVEGAEVQGFTIRAIAGAQAANESSIAGINQALEGNRADIAGILSDPEQKIRDHFKILRETAAAWTSDVNTLTRAYERLQQQEEAALRAARQSNQHASNAMTGRELGPDEAAGIARAAGLQVNSSSRTYAQQKALYDAWTAAGRPSDNPVAAPGTSAHEGARGRWALDIQYGAGVTPELLRKVFADQGVSLSKVFRERGHFHIEGSRSQSDGAAAAEQRENDEQIRRQRDFDQASAGLDAKVLQARRAGLTSVDQIADFERDQVAVEMEKYRLATEAKVQLGDLTRAQADELEHKSALVDTLETEAIERGRQADKLRAAGQLEDELSGHRTDLLQSQEDLAKTAAERRAIELQILDLEKEEARRHYQQVIDLGKIGQATAEQVKAAEDGLKGLDAIYGAREQGVREKTAGPLEAYARDLDQSKARIYERVQGFAVDELEYFRKGLDDAVTKKLGIKDPFLQQLIDLFIEQFLIKPITEAMQRASRQGTSGSGGFLSTVITTISQIAMGAASSGGGGAASYGSAGGGAAHEFAHTAVGTENFSGGYTWLAENGPEIVRLPAGSQVTPAAATRRMLAGSNDNRPVVYQNFDFSGAVTTEDVLRQAEERSRAAAAAAAQAGISDLIDRNRRSYGQLLRAQG